MKLKLALLAGDIHNSVLPHTYSYYGKCLGIEVDFQVCNISEDRFDKTIVDFKESLNGFTVTMPYKIKMMRYCDELDESARKCGSVNTVLVKEGKLTGYNTDGWGMVKFLQYKGFVFNGKNVTLIGAGGVARAIAYELSVNGAAHVDVLNVLEKETNVLVEKMGPLFTGHMLNTENLCKYAKGADVFINASILGQVGYEDYEDVSFLDMLKENALVFDVNYSNPDAKLPKAAAEKGFNSYVGRAMSSCQGIRAMEIWTGKKVCDEDVRKLLEE